MKLNTVIVCGSHRLNSQSIKISKFIEKQICESGGKASIIDLSRNALPLWDERQWEDSPEWKKVWGPLEKDVKAADSFVVVSPEYHGMSPAALKNFFLFCTGELLAHKPALLVTVSAGQGGSYPIVELRSSSYKNSRINYMPEHLIVREAEKVFNKDQPEGSSDEYLRKRLTYDLKLLEQYEKAFKSIRESGVINFKDYPNGM